MYVMCRLVYCVTLVSSRFLPFFPPAIPAITMLPHLSSNLSSRGYGFPKASTWESWELALIPD